MMKCGGERMAIVDDRYIDGFVESGSEWSRHSGFACFFADLH